MFTHKKTYAGLTLIIIAGIMFMTWMTVPMIIGIPMMLTSFALVVIASNLLVDAWDDTKYETHTI